MDPHLHRHAEGKPTVPRGVENRAGAKLALFVIHALRGRGVIGERNESKWTASSKPPIITQNQSPLRSRQRRLSEITGCRRWIFLQHADMTAKPTESKEELMANARLILQSILALRLGSDEMEKRFQIFMRVGATRIGSFNARPKTNVVGSHEDDIVLPEKLSYVVVIN